MMRELVGLSFALLVGCARGDSAPSLVPAASGSARAAASQSSVQGPPPVRSSSAYTASEAEVGPNGLRGLMRAIDRVEQIELVRWEPRAVLALLSNDERAHVLRLLTRGEFVESRTVAHPPWPAALVFRTRSQGTYAATLVGRSNLRQDSSSPDTAGTLEELAVDDPEGWLWAYFESHLGPTKEKEYLAPKAAPDYLELPQKP